MATETLSCRYHGGTFTRESRRGRKPAGCSDDNPCTKANSPTVGKGATKQPAKPMSAREAGETMERVGKAVQRHAKPEKPSKAPKSASASMEKAKQAKDTLEARDWECVGRAFKGVDRAELTATRGEEMIYAVWEDGRLAQPMSYTLWAGEEDTMPARKLPFDPDSTTDEELAEKLLGVKVKWWNRIAQAAETAVCGKTSLSIERVFTSTGAGTDRIIKFSDPETKQFRAFHLSALMRVGK